jgi:hypothetical protein
MEPSIKIALPILQIINYRERAFASLFPLQKESLTHLHLQCVCASGFYATRTKPPRAKVKNASNLSAKKEQ